MRVGVGYSENPDSLIAGMEAAQGALGQVNPVTPCDLVLLFSTSHHDQKILREAVARVVGGKAEIIGGGAVGAMVNNRFGYAGDQVGLAAFWFDKHGYTVVAETGLAKGEEAVGRRLGQQLASLNATIDTPVMLFYDGIDRSEGDVRLLMATPILKGMKDKLGFLPNLVGAGLQGDYACTPTSQWLHGGLVQHSAFGVVFDDSIRLDHVILHGCRPATCYYTVTRAENQAILEINGQPALQFLQNLLGPAISPEQYPFFLILGINRGERWGEFDEKTYANRLCLGIDRERNGIIMFEPDMVAGTEFQIMHRSMDLEYIMPRINSLFDSITGRRPVFSFYIDCAGRAAGYAGNDLEDAVMVQKSVAGKTPLLGIYSGVEIASVMGEARALDWTGVFCLMSVADE